MQKVGKEFFWNYEVLLSDRGTSLSTLSSLNYSQLSRFAAPLTPMAHKRLLGAIPHPAAG